MHGVPMSEREQQNTKLRQLTSKTLELLEAELGDLKAMRDDATAKGKALPQKTARTHRKRVLDVTRALPALLKESRQIGKDDNEWADGLTFAEKRQVIVEFFRLMPREEQVTLLQELTRVVNERRAS